MLVVGVSVRGSMLLVLMLMMTPLMLTCLILEVLGHVHLHLVALVWLRAVQQRVLALMVSLPKHVECGRVCARRAVRRGCVVVVEADSRVIHRRAVTLVEMALVLVLWLVEILAGS